MKKLLIAILVILLIILILVIGFGIYIYINIKTFLFSDDSININIGSQISHVSKGDKHPLLSADQEKTLEKIGIDPAKLPNEITPAMEQCFTEKLGADKVSKIKSGEEEPSVIDFLKAQSCISN